MNVVLWYHHWLSNTIVSSDLEYVYDIVLLIFSSLLKGTPEQVMLAVLGHGTFCGLYLQCLFLKSF